MSERKEFGLIESFDIDGNQLDGLSRQDCYVLGYELASISIKGDLPQAFEHFVHAANVERVRKALRKRERQFLIQPMQDDSSEDWWFLRVKPKGGE